MNVELKKFGTTLVFRERGQEAFKAFNVGLKELPDGENLIVDFSGVVTFSPSWGDEFLTPLSQKYGDRLILENTTNTSVKATLETLSKVKSIKFNVAS